MKHALLLLLFILPSWIIGKETSDDPGLEISFRLYDRDVPVKDYSLTIYEKGTKSDSQLVRKDKEIFLLLELNSNYIIRINKTGFKERLIIAETKVPIGMEQNIFDFGFDVNMIADTIVGNTKADLPVVLIHYDVSEGGFNWSGQYSESVGHDPEVSTASTSTTTPTEDPKPKKKHKLSIAILRKKI